MQAIRRQWQLATMVAVATLLAGATARPAAAQAAQAGKAATLDDPTIVAIFDAANTWDIETAGLAATKGTTKEVRELAQMFVRDHRQVRQQGRDLVAKLGVHPTPPRDFAMAKDHAAAMRELRAAHGKAFDRAFLRNEVAFHQAVIDAVKTTLLPAARHQELKDLMTRVAPAFQAHELAAQRLLDQQAK